MTAESFLKELSEKSKKLYIVWDVFNGCNLQVYTDKKAALERANELQKQTDNNYEILYYEYMGVIAESPKSRPELPNPDGVTPPLVMFTKEECLKICRQFKIMKDQDFELFWGHGDIYYAEWAWVRKDKLEEYLQRDYMQ